MYQRKYLSNLYETDLWDKMDNQSILCLRIACMQLICTAPRDRWCCSLCMKRLR